MQQINKTQIDKLIEIHKKIEERTIIMETNFNNLKTETEKTIKDLDVLSRNTQTKADEEALETLEKDLNNL